ncbi:MAG: hypothetical protein ACYS0G_06300 [Planctomycetota bacterium]|jgi:hypothetical protein
MVATRDLAMWSCGTAILAAILFLGTAPAAAALSDRLTDLSAPGDQGLAPTVGKTGSGEKKAKLRKPSRPKPAQKAKRREPAPRKPAQKTKRRAAAPRKPAQKTKRREAAPRKPAQKTKRREAAPRKPAQKTKRRKAAPRKPADTKRKELKRRAPAPRNFERSAPPPSRRSAGKYASRSAKRPAVRPPARETPPPRRIEKREPAVKRRSASPSIEDRRDRGVAPRRPASSRDSLTNRWNRQPAPPVLVPKTSPRRSLDSNEREAIFGRDAAGKRPSPSTKGPHSLVEVGDSSGPKSDHKSGAGTKSRPDVGAIPRPRPNHDGHNQDAAHRDGHKQDGHTDDGRKRHGRKHRGHRQDGHRYWYRWHHGCYGWWCWCRWWYPYRHSYGYWSYWRSGFSFLYDPYWGWYDRTWSPYSYSYASYDDPTPVYYEVNSTPLPSIDEAWSRLREGDLEVARAFFADLTYALPYEGLPRIGYAITTGLLDDDPAAVDAMRRALRDEPEALWNVPDDPLMQERVRSLEAHYADRVRRDFGDTDGMFMVATLRFVLDEHGNAFFAAEAAIRNGDDDESVYNLRVMLEEVMYDGF